MGKFYLETSSHLKEAYECLHECYLIRKKLLKANGYSSGGLNNDRDGIDGGISTNESPEITRISILLLYLHQKIQTELNDKRDFTAGEQRVDSQNGFKLLNVSYDVKRIFEKEVDKLRNGDSSLTKGHSNETAGFGGPPSTRGKESSKTASATVGSQN